MSRHVLSIAALLQTLSFATGACGLEAEVIHQDPALAFLAYDDEHHCMDFANLDTLKGESKDHSPSRGETGVNHLAFTSKCLGAGCRVSAFGTRTFLCYFRVRT